MVRAVARGSTIKILRLDPDSIDEFIEFLSHGIPRDFTGRIEGEVSSDGERYNVLLLIESGKLVGAGVSNNEEVRGDDALNKLIEVLRRGEGFLEVSQLTEAGVRLDMEFNDGIQLSAPIDIDTVVEKLAGMKAPSRGVEEAAVEAPKPVEETVKASPPQPQPAPPKPIEETPPRPSAAPAPQPSPPPQAPELAPAPATAQQPQPPAEAPKVVESVGAEAKPSPPPPPPQPKAVSTALAERGFEEFRETLARAIRELEEQLGPIEVEQIPPPPPGVPRIRIEDLPMHITENLEGLSSFVVEEVCNLAPRIFLKAIPLAKGSGKILDILTRVREYIGRLGEPGPYLLIVRYGNRAFYSILVRDTMCCIIELNEIPLKPLDHGPRALENMISNPEVEFHYILWKLPGGDELIKKIVAECRVEETAPHRAEERGGEERRAEETPAPQPRRRRFFRLFGR